MGENALWEPAAVYVAPRGFEEALAGELARRDVEIGARRGRLFLARSVPDEPVAWAQNVWLAPRFARAPSIGAAARELAAMGRNWAFHESACAEGARRRAALIAAKLPHVSRRPLAFGESAPSAPLGAWTLWEPDCLLASTAASSPFADGEAHFVENRSDPPSRAYLKLWEAFTILGTRPAPGETCLDLGCSPGGWTWALAALGARVTAVDKAPLAPAVMQQEEVAYVPASAFSLDPRSLPGGIRRFDWFFSDVICYPARLLATVRRFLEADAAANFVCTLKFQGRTDYDIADEFAAIPGSRLMHLSCNRHELTWTLIRETRT